MVVNFSTCEINQGMRKLIWTLTSIKKKKEIATVDETV